MARVLVVEDENILRKNLVDRLRAEGHDVYDAASAESGAELAALLAPDLVLTDLRLPGMDGLELLKRIKSASARTMVVLMTAVGTQQTAVEAVREGAYDYLTKPVALKELVLLVSRAVSHSRALDRVQYARQVERRSGTLEQIVGVSAAIRELKNRVRQLVASPMLAADDPPAVLIRGETGTGKTLLAHAIHNEGPRRDGPFVTVSCAALSDEAAAGELFGAAADAGPAARVGRGLIETAEGGTLFLEEIAGLSPRMQARLLAAMESRAAPGAARRIDAHLIATTSRDLAREQAAGRFLPELYHRIGAVRFELLSLRRRPEDVAPLAERFLTLHARRAGRNVPGMDAEAVAALARYDWPGNARELSHVMERALLVSGGQSLTAADLGLPAGPSVPAGADGRVTVEAGGSPRRLAVGEAVRIELGAGWPTLAEIEAVVMRAAWAHFGGDAEKAAAALGVEVGRVLGSLDGAGAAMASGRAGL